MSYVGFTPEWLAQRERDKSIERRAEKPSKFKNVKTDGYASKKEAMRAVQLGLMQKAGLIRFLREQVDFPLIVNGIEVCVYRCDFSYQRAEKIADDLGVANIRWNDVVEDVKSSHTAKLPVYRLKKKLMKACLGIDVEEVV